MNGAIAAAAHGDGARGSEAALPHGGGATTSASPDESHRFRVCDIVIGRATKWKDRYHDKRAKVTAVLSKQYRVTMLEGGDEGTSHKYHGL